MKPIYNGHSRAATCPRCRTTLYNAGAMQAHRAQCVGHVPRKAVVR